MAENLVEWPQPEYPSKTIKRSVSIMDQMLQCMEVNFRTCCDLLRYQQMKKASAVRDMDEFLDVLYPGNTEEEQDESV